jgi:TetR/AcrR family transcriptional regulator
MSVDQPEAAGNVVNRNAAAGILPGKSNVPAAGCCAFPEPSLSSSPSSRGGREADVRERIFASALHHFSRKGFAATSLREVSEDAQTTKPMIYYYFGSKEGLYASIVRQILEEMADTIRSNLPAEAPVKQQVMAFSQSYLEHFLQQEEIIALVLREVFGLGGVSMAEFSQGLGDRVRQPLDAIILRGMDTGVFRQDHVPTCSTAVTGILNMFILVHVFGGAEIDRDSPLRQVGYYIDGLCAR